MPGFSVLFSDMLTLWPTDPSLCIQIVFNRSFHFYFCAFLIWCKKILFHLIIQSVIMAVALVPDQAIFDNISLVRIGAHFMDDSQECIRWCWQYGLLATQMICPTCNHQCREQALDRAVDGATWHCPEKVCKKRISIRHGSFFEKSHL